jgi:MoaA/NifB/PqqE/SkfB family radical SAM enzyme
LQPRKGPLGFHFFDRESGVNVLIDEFIPQTNEWSAAPRTLSVALSYACDYACPHCFAPKTHHSLCSADVLGWARELAGAGGHCIGFGGGEPTIYPGLASLCMSIAAETALSVTLTTHGHNFTRTLASALSGSVHFIRVSLGGLGDTYEAVHGRPFSRLLASLPAIRDAAPVGFNCLVNGTTLPSLNETAEFALENGAAEILLLPEVTAEGKLRLNRQEQSMLATWIDSNQGHMPLALSAMASEAIPTDRLPVEDPRGPSFDFMHVDAEARLRGSAFGGRWVRISPSSGLMAAIEQHRNGASNHWEAA